MTQETRPHCNITIDVPFHDIDMLNVVWHGHYYKYFELARTALFRKYRFDVPRIREMGYAMMVVDSRCRYKAPLAYGMKAVVKAVVVELEFRIKIDYFLREAETGRKLANGSTTQVTLTGENRELCMVTPQEIVDVFTSNESTPGKGMEL